MPFRPPRPRSTRRALAAVAALGVAGVLARPAAAQVTEGPLSPAGRLRVEVSPSFVQWSTRFGEHSVDGTTVDTVEPLGYDLEGEHGFEAFPGLATLQSNLQSIFQGIYGEPRFQVDLGPTTAAVTQNITRIPVHLDLGVFDRLTLGVTVPFVKTQTDVALGFPLPLSQINVGLNPAITQPGALSAFLESLGAGAAAASARADELCGAGDPGCDDVRQLATRLSELDTHLVKAYGSGPFFPVAGDPMGDALQANMSVLNGLMSDAGLPPVQEALPLASRPLTQDDLAQAFSDPRGGIAAAPPGNIPGLWRLGDVEVTAAVRLLDGQSADSAGAPPRARWQVGARALVRLGTGTPANPDVFFDLGSGDGQTDVEVGAFANVRVGHVGVWADARYGVQRPVVVERRVAPPDVVFAPRATRLPVTWTPGNYVQLELSPRWHLTPEFALAGSWRYWHKGEDSYAIAGTVPADVMLPDPAVLSLETAQTLHEVGGGLVFSTLEAWREGRAPVPFEVRLGVSDAVAGSGGRTPRALRVQGGVRLYQRIWGR